VPFVGNIHGKFGNAALH